MNNKKIYSCPQIKCSPSRLRVDFMSDFIESLNKSDEVQTGEVGTKDRYAEPVENDYWGKIW